MIKTKTKHMEGPKQKMMEGLKVLLKTQININKIS